MEAINDFKNLIFIELQKLAQLQDLVVKNTTLRLIADILTKHPFPKVKNAIELAAYDEMHKFTLNAITRHIDHGYLSPPEALLQMKKIKIYHENIPKNKMHYFKNVDYVMFSAWAEYIHPIDIKHGSSIDEVDRDKKFDYNLCEAFKAHYVTKLKPWRLNHPTAQSMLNGLVYKIEDKQVLKQHPQAVAL